MGWIEGSSNLKGIKSILIILLVLFVGVGCSAKRSDSVNSNHKPAVSAEETAFHKDITNKQMAAFEPFFKIENEANIKLKTVCMADYRYMTPKQLYESSDLIVIGRFSKNNGSFVEQNGRILTNADVVAERVIKGNLNGRAISMLFNGGSVPFIDYYNSYDKGSQNKMNIDISTIKPADLVQSYWGKHQAYPFIGKQYLLFLNKTKSENIHCLVSDEYGMLEIKDDMYFDIYANEWKNITELGN